MNGILIDENLPRRLKLPTKLPITHARDLGESLSDTEIWEVARKQDLVILTKDSDFSFRIMSSDPPPRIVHLRVGNLRLRELASLIEMRWLRIECLLQQAKLVNIFPDRIESVN